MNFRDGPHDHNHRNCPAMPSNQGCKDSKGVREGLGARRDSESVSKLVERGEGWGKGERGGYLVDCAWGVKEDGLGGVADGAI